MTQPALAPTHLDKQVTNVDDPFATPARVDSFPATPQPCAFPYHDENATRHAIASRDAAPGHHRQQSSVHKTYKPGSVSSAGDSSIMTPGTSVDLEKAGLKREARKPKRSSRGSSGSKQHSNNRCEEKVMPGSPDHLAHSSDRGAGTRQTYEEDDDEVDEGRQAQEQHVLKILFFLSGPCVLLSALNTAWACIALVVTALSQPIRICAKRPTFGQQLAGLLGPTLNLQLRSIYTPLPPHANEDSSYHTMMLVMIHMLSPFLSFVVMFASWTLAVYWLSSTIVGDPAGQDKRDDGKETVLGLRNWWERWLMRCIKEEFIDS